MFFRPTFASRLDTGQVKLVATCGQKVVAAGKEADRLVGLFFEGKGEGGVSETANHKPGVR